MNKSTSLFMDALRVFAALTVFLGHLSFSDFLGAFVWGAPLAAYGFDAVIIFFVLSGFVIGFVVDAKEKSGTAYGIARFTRLASVLWPALLITLACDALGRAINPAFYANAWWYTSSHPAVRVAMNLFALNQVAGQDIRAFSNGPLWSVSYEAWYYLAFGCWRFLPRFKALAAVGVLLLAGPGIAMLFPIWLAGYWLYRFTKTRALGPRQGAMLALAGVLGFAVFKAFGGMPHNPAAILGWTPPPPFWGRTESVVEAYVTGLCSMALLGGAAALLGKIQAKRVPFEGAIRRLSDCTFPLYATHYPVIWAIAAMWGGHSTGRALTLLVVPLAIAWLVAIAGNRFRDRMRDWARAASL